MRRFVGARYVYSYKIFFNLSVTTFCYFLYLCTPKSTKFFNNMRRKINLHYYISAAYIYIPYHHNISTNWED